MPHEYQYSFRNSLYKMFIIADFRNENVTDVVCAKWLIDSTRCNWPPKKFQSYEVANYIRKQVEQETDSWKIYSIDIISKAGILILIYIF